MPPGISGDIIYLHDELDRLVGVVAGNGEVARYRYDAVGNLLSISRHLSTEVTIVDFTPNAGRVGDVVAIRGAGFSAIASENTVQFNGVGAVVQSVTPVELVVIVPEGAASGPISVSTPNGNGSSVDDFDVLPSLPEVVITDFNPKSGAPGTQVTITGTGFELNHVNNKVSFGGKTAFVSASSATSINAQVAERSSTGRVKVVTPMGTAMSSDEFVVSPGGYTGDQIESTVEISIGTTSQHEISTPEKAMMLTFDAVAGQRLAVEFSNVTIPSLTKAYIYKPDDSQWMNPINFSSSGGFFDADVVPETGTYTIIVDPFGTNVGAFDVTIIDVGPDVTGEINIDSIPVLASNVIKGQNIALTFSATAGQKIIVKIDNESLHTFSNVHLLDVNGDAIAIKSSLPSNGEAYIDMVTLPDTGTYTVYVDPYSRSLGSASITLIEAVEEQLYATINADGIPVQISNTRAGQSIIVNFTANTGQRIALLANNSTLHAFSDIRLRDPNGVLLAEYPQINPDAFIDARVLTESGTYAIEIDPYGASIGSVTLTLYTVPDDVQGSLVSDGEPVVVTNSVPGQNISFAFTATSGQRVSLLANDASLHRNSDVQLIGPDGEKIRWVNSLFSSGSFIDAVTLSTAGTYQVFVDPYRASVGQVTLRLYNVPADVQGNISIGGPTVTVANTVPGQNAMLAFNAIAGDEVSLETSELTLSRYSDLRIIDPTGVAIATLGTLSTSGSLLGPVTLAETGAYSIAVDPDSNSVGSVTLKLNDSSDVTGVIAADGIPVTISNTKAGQNMALTFEGTAGQAVSLNVTNPSISTSSDVIIRDPNGVALRTLTSIGSSGSFIDPVNLPETGVYTVYVDPHGTSVGEVTLTLYTVAGDITGNISPDGTPTTVTTITPGQNALLSFTGSANQRVFLHFYDASISTQSWVKIISPDGTVLNSKRVYQDIIDVQTLVVTGEHTIQLDGSGSSVGSLTFALYTVAEDINSTIIINGSPVTVTTTTPGQNAALSFNATAGDEVSLLADELTLSRYSDLKMIAPSGVELASLNVLSTSGSLLGPVTLAETGLYSIKVDPDSYSVGSVTLTLRDTRDINSAITADGTPITVSNTAAGQNIAVTFNGTAGQLVSLEVLDPSISTSSDVIIRDPNGEALRTITSISSSGSFFSSFSLPDTGVYTIYVDPYGISVGSVTLALYTVEHINGTIPADGTPTTVTTTIPGQHVYLEFDGLADQRVFLDFYNPTINNQTSVKILKPDGTVLSSARVYQGFIDVHSLDAAGVYTIHVDVSGSSVGSLTLELYTVPEDISGMISADGVPVTVTTLVPGQNASLTFSGSMGDRVNLLFGNETLNSQSRINIVNPDGTTLISKRVYQDYTGVVVLPETGTYTVEVDPYGTLVGYVDLALYTVPPDVTADLLINGGSVHIIIDVPGQNALLSFSGDAGALVTVRVANNSAGYSTVRLRDPNGTQLAYRTTSAAAFTLSQQVLPETGIYTIEVDPSGTNTGALDIEVTNP